jgi:hypothetical protein
MKTETYEENGIIYYITTNEETDYCTEEEKSDRLTICQTCEFFDNGTCSQCGCISETLILLKDKICPENKW